MHDTGQKRCEQCRYYLPKANHLGECRRYALHSGSPAATWPLVFREDWCGEHVNALVYNHIRGRLNVLREKLGASDA